MNCGLPSSWLSPASRCAAVDLSDLRSPPGNHLEKLTGDRIGQHSIRINDQFRICFVWTEEGPKEVEITDHH
jgi:proteic killer suppression protein